MTDSTEEEYSQAVMKTLARAPVIVFLAVASADGKLDKKEIKRFGDLIKHPDHAILAAAMAKAQMSVGDLLADVIGGNYDPLAELRRAAHLLDVHTSNEVAAAYKMTLLKLAKGVAEASGGLFGLFGSKISKEEEAMLALIADALGLLGGNEQSPVEPLDPQTLANVYPALKPAEWAARAKDVVLQSVYGTDEIQPDEPVVAFAIDHPEAIEFINQDRLNASFTLDMLRTRAMENLERRLSGKVVWREISIDTHSEGLGKVDGLVLVGDYFCSEALLLEKALKQAHEALDAALLMAIAPVRGELLVTRLVSEASPEPERLAFARFAIKRYFNPPEAPIAPTVWIVRNSRLVGHVAGMEMIIENARQIAELELAEEERKLEHSIEQVTAGDGYSLRIAVIAHDVAVMLRNLQNVLRDYVAKARSGEGFNGEVEVSVNIRDPEYRPDGRTELDSKMEDLCGYLNRQWAELRMTTAAGVPIHLSYSLEV